MKITTLESPHNTGTSYLKQYSDSKNFIAAHDNTDRDLLGPNSCQLQSTNNSSNYKASFLGSPDVESGYLTVGQFINSGTGDSYIRVNRIELGEETNSWRATTRSYRENGTVLIVTERIQTPSEDGNEEITVDSTFVVDQGTGVVTALEAL